MNAPDKCPRCGQPTPHSFTQCIVDQRDALAARVKELEEKLEAWKAYAGRLEEAGNMMAAVLGLKAVFYCVEKWTQAKESKP